MKYAPIALFVLLVVAVVYTVYKRSDNSARYNIKDGSNNEMAAAAAAAGAPIGNHSTRNPTR